MLTRPSSTEVPDHEISAYFSAHLQKGPSEVRNQRFVSLADLYTPKTETYPIKVETTPEPARSIRAITKAMPKDNDAPCKL